MEQLLFALALILIAFLAAVGVVLIGFKLVNRLLDNQPVAYSTVIFDSEDAE